MAINPVALIEKQFIKLYELYALDFKFENKQSLKDLSIKIQEELTVSMA